jgi:hypothetical protein
VDIPVVLDLGCLVLAYFMSIYALEKSVEDRNDLASVVVALCQIGLVSGVVTMAVVNYGPVAIALAVPMIVLGIYPLRGVYRQEVLPAEVTLVFEESLDMRSFEDFVPSEVRVRDEEP